MQRRECGISGTLFEAAISFIGQFFHPTTASFKIKQAG
jgi:hypothetical protein